MSLARIHDKHKLKKYWEEKIESHGDMMGSEESRMKSSALSKLRDEWLRRLKLREPTTTGEFRRETHQEGQDVPTGRQDTQSMIFESTSF